MAEDKAKAIPQSGAKTGADRLVLDEIRRRLDWVGADRVILGHKDALKHMDVLEKEGFIQDFRFSNLEVKVNGTWYKG